MNQHIHKAEIGLRKCLRAKRSSTATVALDIQGHGKVKNMIGIINIPTEVTPRILESHKRILESPQYAVRRGTAGKLATLMK